jgi:branched-chain amino acid transport system ATP-binding protein
MLELHKVGVRLGPVVALADVSLSVPAATIVGIIGPNGAGKTTLFNVVCGLVTPQTGTMTLDGRPWRPRPDRLVAAGLARTLQHGGLFASLTVLENVMVGVRADRTGPDAAALGQPRATRGERAVRQRAWAALEELRLEPYADARPATLPHALRRRVALARALASDPRLLLLDEPAGGLSADQIEELAVLLAALPSQRGCAVLLVEHRLDLVMRVCHDVAVLDLGRVIAHGTPDQVRADPAVATAYLGAG